MRCSEHHLFNRHAAKSICYFLPSDRRGALQKLGMAPAKGGFAGAIRPRRLVSRGTGSHLAMRIMHKYHDPLERTEPSGLWDYRPAQTSRRCSASVLAAVRFEGETNKSDVTRVVIAM